MLRLTFDDHAACLQGEDPSTGNPNFWDELFLLKVGVYFFIKMATAGVFFVAVYVNSLSYVSGLCRQSPGSAATRFVQYFNTGMRKTNLELLILYWNFGE